MAIPPPIPTNELKRGTGWNPSIRYFIIGLIELLILLLLFYKTVRTDLSSGGCLSADGTYDTCYCEAFSDGYVLEPVNTYSALAFSALGFVILYTLSRTPPPQITNLMTQNIIYSAVYGYLEVFMGPGSMLFHATMSNLGGFFDTLSMYMWLSYVLVYDILRLTNISNAIGALLYIFVVSLCVVLQEMVFQGGDLTFALLVFAALGAELIVYLRSRNNLNKTAYKYFILALLVYAVAMVIWQLSKTGGPLCFPDSLLQGHAVWHTLSAVTVSLIYVYLKKANDPQKITK
jgi:hypothetical protein